MMSTLKLRRLLVFTPIPASYFMSDGTINSAIIMLIGGLIFWIPFWLALWLSDGFANVQLGDFDWDKKMKRQNGPRLTYRNGPQGLGLYSRSGRIN